MNVTIPGPGLLAVPLAVAAAAALALAGSSAAGAAPGKAEKAEMVELEVRGVVPMDDEKASVVVLQSKTGGTMLPIFIGRGEADAIDQRLKKTTPPRPLTHDLLEKAIKSLGGRVTRVEIQSVTKDSVFYARIFLAQGDRTVELDARPSDSIALAVGASAPIYAARQVMDAVGLTHEDLEKLKKTHPPAGGAAATGDEPPSDTRL